MGHPMKRERTIVTAWGSQLVPWVAALSSTCPAGAAAQEATAAPPRRVQQEALSPDARRFVPSPLLAYWAGTERVFEDELSPAAPRPLDRGKLLPALDDDPKTTAIMRGAASLGPGHETWQVLELGSMHEIEGGSVLSVHFRVDEREKRAEQGFVMLTLPVEKLWLVPVVGLGAGGDFSPNLVVGNEVRSNRELPYGYAIGFETSRWTHHRDRIMAKAAGVYRISPNVALEERVAIGGWSGQQTGDRVALQWTTAGLQALGSRTMLYERATLAHSPAAPVDGTRDDSYAWSVDMACGLRRSFSSIYGAVIQASFGSQPSRYERFGVDLTLYGTLF